MIQINIGIVLDACGISYTEKQLTKLEECINNFIQQYIDENMNHFQQNSSHNFETRNVVENVMEQKEFVKTEIKASFDEEIDFLQNGNISLECNQTESVKTNLDPLEKVISRKQMLSKSTIKQQTISTESRTDPMTFDLLKEELQENIESSLIEESNQIEQVSNVINYVTQIDNVLTEVPNLKETNILEEKGHKNVREQKEFVKTEIKSSCDEEMDFFQNGNISLECNRTENNLDPLEEVISRNQMLSKSTIQTPTISTESRTDPMTFDLLKEELQENIEPSLIEESNQTAQVSNVKKKSNVINYVTQIDNVLTEVPTIKKQIF